MLHLEIFKVVHNMHTSNFEGLKMEPRELGMLGKCSAT